MPSWMTEATGTPEQSSQLSSQAASGMQNSLSASMALWRTFLRQQADLNEQMRLYGAQPGQRKKLDWGVEATAEIPASIGRRL